MNVIYLLAMNTQFVVNTIIGQYNYQNFNYYLFYCNASFGKIFLLYMRLRLDMLSNVLWIKI